MESEAPTLMLNHQAKLDFASELSNLCNKIFNFYIENCLFFIPNDLLEAIASLLGYYLIDSFPRTTAAFEKNQMLAKQTLSSHTAQGYKLASLLKKHQENLTYILASNAHFNETNLIRANIVLDINSALSEVLMISNKRSDIIKPSATTHSSADLFVRNPLYAELKNFITHFSSIDPAQKPSFVLTELSIYVGWLSGFYANLLETPEELFVNYCYVSIDTAATQKSMH